LNKTAGLNEGRLGRIKKEEQAKRMRFKESEKRELKKSTSALKEAIVSIAAILNKHQNISIGR
jgi:hypothetical protein